MKLRWKKFLAFFLAAGLSVSAALPAWAGEWKKLEGGDFWQWWYQEDNGAYPANTWKEIEGKWYHFDNNGYLDVGWKYLDGKWYYLDSSGAMTANAQYFGGHLGEDGAWVSDRVPPANRWVATGDDNAYWAGKQAQYGLSGEMFTDHGDGSFVLTCNYDPSIVLPDLLDAVLSTCAYRFNGCSYDWQAVNGVLTFRVTNAGYY